MACWLIAAGIPLFLRQHTESFCDLLNTGLDTAGESFRVAELLAMHSEHVRRNHVIWWFCFRATNGCTYWAVASPLTKGSITYGRCGESCPPLPESIAKTQNKRRTWQRWRGYLWMAAKLGLW